MSSRNAVVTFGVAAVLAGGGTTVAGATGGDTQTRAESPQAQSASAGGHEYRKHRRECLRERRANPSGFKKDHGTLKRCIAQERAADAKEDARERREEANDE